MLSFLKKIFGHGGRQKRYALQTQQLKSGDPAALYALASSEATNPEILYYLAQTGDATIRRALAVNKSTPLQAATLLAQDADLDVRLVLAARLLKLLPGLTPEKHSQLYAYAVQALGMLAQDEMLQVRRALTTVLNDYAKAPPAVVNRLARDVEREVAEPILRFCVALADEDLLDILGHHPAPWAIAAVANRDAVSPPVAEAVVDTGDVAATTALVLNKGASLPEVTLQRIVDQAKGHPDWHKPIALRPELSVALARQMIGFVDKVVLDVLEKRSDFDAATRKQVSTMVHRRLAYLHDGPSDQTAEEKVLEMAQSGKLTPDAMEDALAWGENAFVVGALAYFARIHPQVVRRMIDTATPKPVVALCWKAQLPMRVCVELQQRLAKIPPRDIMYAKGGTDYPLTTDEIKWQLEFFGVGA